MNTYLILFQLAKFRPWETAQLKTSTTPLTKIEGRPISTLIVPFQPISPSPTKMLFLTAWMTHLHHTVVVGSRPPRPPALLLADLVPHTGAEEVTCTEVRIMEDGVEVTAAPVPEDGQMVQETAAAAATVGILVEFTGDRWDLRVGTVSDL